MMDLPPDILALLKGGRLDSLTVRTPDSALRASLAHFAREFPARAKDRDFAQAFLAGLWLSHDFFDESHSLSQDLGSLEGSYWHAILHRREPDYWNSKYWFRRVPRHPIHEALNAAARGVTKPAGLGFSIPAQGWDASAFVDLCEANAVPGSAGHEFCVQVQKCEWELLFAYCHAQALGAAPRP